MLHAIAVAYLFIKYKLMLYHIKDIDKWIITLIACNYIYFLSIISFKSKSVKSKIAIILLNLVEMTFIIISFLLFQWLIFSFIIIRLSTILILFKYFNFDYNIGIKIMERKEMVEWQQKEFNKQSQILFISGIYIYILPILALVPFYLLIKGYLNVKYFWIVFIYIILLINVAYLIKYIKSKESYLISLKHFIMQISLPMMVTIISALIYKIAKEYNFEKFLGYVIAYSIFFDFIFVERERLARLFYVNKNKII